MLDDKELKKLCFGRIIFAEVYDSAGNGPAGPHPGIILNTDEQIRRLEREQNPTYDVVVISHNDVIDPDFLMAVPARTGIDGEIVGSWTTPVHERDITAINPHMLSVPEMIKVQELVRAADKARKAAKKSTQ